MDINQLAVYSKKASASIHGAMRAPVRQSPACQLLVALTVFAAAALLMTAAVARGAEDPRCMGMESTLLGGLTLDCGNKGGRFVLIRASLLSNRPGTDVQAYGRRSRRPTDWFDAF